MSITNSIFDYITGNKNIEFLKEITSELNISSATMTTLQSYFKAMNDFLEKMFGSEETKRVLEDIVARIEAEKLLKKIEEHLKDIPELPPGTVVKWIRSDRESH
jgi:glycerol dehydrogenase-like iron-containing ADH family enzyme